MIFKIAGFSLDSFNTSKKSFNSLSVGGSTLRDCLGGCFVEKVISLISAGSTYMYIYSNQYVPS